MPVSDYGGFAHNRGHAQCVAKDIRHCHSFRCDDCKHIQYVPFLATRRAARIACDRCGGRLDYTEAEKRRQVWHERTLARLRREPTLDQCRRAEKRCRACGLGFIGGVASVDDLLTLHLKNNRFCREDYQREGYALPEDLS